ncbi:MAG TPA: DUF1343 domain-containing protein [Lentibacillus sp.]|uniref:exo-beta-N-acetylmuramidase NamZ family protein n=1 Tax=Lentibacillus sp. TaxID=1925746 RepID=UPI002B4B8646|nr:DUF1343 domain-containing protein [Lentibacillus sp.]HLR63637.1 DUF1343 domain-containing protein [Lentibacillus sp.]
MRTLKLMMMILIFVLALTSSQIISSANDINDNKGNNGNQKVTPGIEVLLNKKLKWLKNKRVGLITNPTGVASNLESNIDLLYDHPEVNLTALYGPEHGIRGNREAGEYVESYIDEKTGLPVYSLYGPTWKPTEEMLEDVDVLLFDIQDIGSNVYTYIYTLGFAMEAAAEHDKELIVLDRPNPIGGTKVEGPVRSEDAVSFMGRFMLPVRHGMTVGELAVMWNHEYSMGVDLKVAQMKGWKRTMHFEDTGLPWVMTSPNIPTRNTAYLYAGTELLDDTTLTTGLGTTRPFELVGAPWIDGEALAEEMNDRDIAGVTFRSAYFTPMFGKYEGEMVGGVQVHMDDPSQVDLVNLGLHLVDAMRDQNPEKFEMTSSYANLIGDTEVPDMIMNNEPVEDIIGSWREELDTWVEDVRNQYLMYPPYPSGSPPYKQDGILGILPLDLTAAPGQNIDLTVRGFNKHGEKLDIDPDSIEWDASNDIGYVENGTFYAEKEGQGRITATYDGYQASREAEVSATQVENIRHAVHSGYTRVVFDLNKSINNYDLIKHGDTLRLEVPYGDISGELNEDGDTIEISNSPSLSSIEYSQEEEMFVAVFNLKKEKVQFETPEFSSRLVIDIKHE